ncbi:hypothetical protein NL676_016202 [Syzygium grande]|nr:hypothetical protein NL676_016202 [Syzygium grande]
MLRALSLFKEYSGGGILAQVWVPIKLGDQYVLSTLSRTFTFSAEEKPGTFLGLPGHVFTSKVPEWTSNVMYYNNGEYLRVKHAVHHNIRGSIALPVFDSSDKPCSAVLELLTMKEKPIFDLEMEKMCLALRAVNFRTTPPPRLLPQCLSSNQRAALAEITDVLRAVCHAHRFPLALTWIPCCFSEGAADEILRVFINVPWRYLAFYAMISPFLTHGTKSKFVFASSSRTMETLFKYISLEQVPVQYDGLSVAYCDCDPEFTVSDPATKMIVKPGTKQIVEIIIYEKPKKMSPADEPVAHGTVKVSELGKVLLTAEMAWRYIFLYETITNSVTISLISPSRRT